MLKGLNSQVEKETLEIRRASQNFFSGTLLSRVLGLLRDVLMAGFFGASASLAALLVAYRFSNLLRRLFGEGALHAAFVPLYESYKARSKKEAAVFFIQLSWVLFLFLSLLTLVVLFSLASALKYKISFSSREVIQLSMIFFPSLFFICHCAFCSSYLQCHGIYFLPAFAPVQFNLVWIAGLFVSAFISPFSPIFTLACFIALGLFAQWALLIPKVFRTLQKETLHFEGVSLRQSGSSLSLILKPFLMGLLGTSATQLNSALDSIFARFVDLKGPAYLWYALRIEQVPLALFGIALSGALLPSLSRLFQTSTQDFKLVLERGITKSLGLLIPSQIALYGFAPLIIRLIYQRGNFEALATSQTMFCLRAYSVGLLFQSLNLLFSSAFYAAKDYRTPVKATFLALISNVICNSYFVFFLSWGATSIAIATSLSAFLQFMFLGGVLRKRGMIYDSTQKVLLGLKIVWISAISLSIGRFVIFKAFNEGFFASLFQFLVQGGVFIAFLGGLAFLLKVEEIKELFKLVVYRKKQNKSTS